MKLQRNAFLFLFASLLLPLSSGTARQTLDETPQTPAIPPTVTEAPITTLPSVVAFRFEGGKSLLVPGSGSEKGAAASCEGNFPDAEVVGNFTVASTFYQNGCYTDGNYSHRQFRLTVGRLLGSDGESYDAVQVDEPKEKAKKFLASHHFLFFRRSEKVDHFVYTFDRGTLRPLGKLVATNDGFVRIPDADLSVMSGSVVYVIAKGRQISAYHRLNPQTEGAAFVRTPVGMQEKRRLKVSGRPFDTAQDFTAGPADHANVYGINRQFFFLPLAPTPGIVYQDKSSGKIQLVSLDEELLFRSERTLTAAATEILGGACADERGNIYLLRVQTGSGSGRVVRIQKYTSAGVLIKEQQYDSSKAGLNLFQYGQNLSMASSVSSMVWSDGTLGIILSRTMHTSPDGLNHQGAIAFTVDAESLALVKNLGQTSGHSFGNFLYADDGGFVGVDLGDNYPRGVHLHRFDATRRDGRVVFTFKTEHGSTPKSPAGKSYPPYREISTPTKPFYQWSNDNRTYTEIGGLAFTEKGYFVLFATEFPTLENAHTGANLVDARNLAVVYVRRDFEKVPSKGNNVQDEMMLFKTEGVKGQFYDFGGRLNEQRNAGFRMLTDFSSTDKNVSRPRLIRAGEDRNVAFYEVWTAHAYATTQMLVFNDEGKVTDRFELGPSWRMNRQDDVYLYKGRLISLAGSAADQTIEINSLTLP